MKNKLTSAVPAQPETSAADRLFTALSIVATVRHAIRDEQPDEHAALEHAVELLWKTHEEIERASQDRAEGRAA